MLKLFFNLLIFFFNKNLYNFFKCFFFKKGFLHVLTNYNFYFNLLFFLKKSTFFQLKMLVDTVVIDFPNKFNRFLITYLLLSLNLNFRLNVSFCFNELFPLLTIKDLYSNSN